MLLTDYGKTLDFRRKPAMLTEWCEPLSVYLSDKNPVKIEWPFSLRWARANGLTKMVPWHFLADGEGAGADEQFKKERIDSREVRTFAKRQDCDDFAGFLVVDGIITDRVLYFHPSFASTRNEYMINSEHEDFWEFFRDVVIPDTKDWGSEADLKDQV